MISFHIWDLISLIGGDGIDENEAGRFRSRSPAVRVVEEALALGSLSAVLRGGEGGPGVVCTV